jgi:hypothetical protein
MPSNGIRIHTADAFSVAVFLPLFSFAGHAATWKKGSSATSEQVIFIRLILSEPRRLKVTNNDSTILNTFVAFQRTVFPTHFLPC